MNKKIKISISMIFSTILLIPGNAFAAFDNEMKWELIFVTSWENCSKRNLQAMNFYEDITGKYLSIYNINHKHIKSSCINNNELLSIIHQKLKNNDLVIIIPDLFSSIDQRISSGTSGHFAYYGNTQSIVSQALSYKIESKSSSWILSHELSHFALKWKGYSKDISESMVHKIQNEYDNCLSNNFINAICSKLWTPITTISGKQFPVMIPIYTKDNYPKPIEQIPEKTEIKSKFTIIKNTEKPKQKQIEPKIQYSSDNQNYINLANKEITIIPELNNYENIGNKELIIIPELPKENKKPEPKIMIKNIKQIEKFCIFWFCW